MRAFNQGQLDCFCAAYAVLNALRILHSLSVGGARLLFNEMLLDLAEDPDEFALVAFNATDHTAWVERLLANLRGTSRAVRVQRPFSAKTPWPRLPSRLELDSGRNRITPGKGIDADMIWDSLGNWLSSGTLHRPRTAVLRFHRYLAMSGAPVVSHWSTAERIEGDVLHLLDASTEATAIHAIPRVELAESPAAVSPERLLHIEPATIFLLERG